MMVSSSTVLQQPLLQWRILLFVCHAVLCVRASFSSSSIGCGRKRQQVAFGIQQQQRGRWHHPAMTTTSTTTTPPTGELHSAVVADATATPSTSESSSSSTSPLVSFSKYEGLGNDFILVDDRDNLEPSLTPRQAQRLCDRHFGVGGDGVIFALRAPPPPDNDNEEQKYDYAMRIYNSDGSEPEMCGNGIRCMAQFLQDLDDDGGEAEQGQLQQQPQEATTTYKIHTLAGPILPVMNGDGSITVDMGKPILEAASVPTTLEATLKRDNDNAVVEQTVTDLNGKQWKVSAVSMGNPHAVVFVDDLDADVDLAVDGPALESHTDVFPAKINAEFVQVLSRADANENDKKKNHLKMKVWERGAGPTLACGTGACALTVAAVLAEKIPRAPTTVSLPGGNLIIDWRENDEDKVYMTGPANFAFRGQAKV